MIWSWGQALKPQGLATKDPVLQVKLYLLKVPQPSKTSPLAEEQVFRHMNLRWTFSMQTTTVCDKRGVSSPKPTWHLSWDGEWWSWWISYESHAIIQENSRISSGLYLGCLGETALSSGSQGELGASNGIKLWNPMLPQTLCSSGGQSSGMSNQYVKSVFSSPSKFFRELSALFIGFIDFAILVPLGNFTTYQSPC